MPRQSIVPFIIRQPPRIGTIFRTNRQTALGIHHPLAAAPGLPALGLRGNLEVPLVWSRDLIGHRGNSRAQACRQRKRHDAPERTGGGLSRSPHNSSYHAKRIGFIIPHLT